MCLLRKICWTITLLNIIPWNKRFLQFVIFQVLNFWKNISLRIPHLACLVALYVGKKMIGDTMLKNMLKTFIFLDLCLIVANIVIKSLPQETTWIITLLNIIVQINSFKRHDWIVFLQVPNSWTITLQKINLACTVALCVGSKLRIEVTWKSTLKTSTFLVPLAINANIVIKYLLPETI